MFSRNTKTPALSAQARVAFYATLASAQRGGQPLRNALVLLAEDDIDDRLSRAARTLAERMADKSLPAAMTQMPQTFTGAEADMLHEAEKSGRLAEALELLASDAARMTELTPRISLALAFPATGLVVACLAIAVFMIFVVPAFKEMFTAFGSDLPALTLALFEVSDAATSYWYVWLPLVIAGVLAFAKRSKYDYGRRIDRVLLRLPYLGDFLRKAHRARMAGLLADGVRLGFALQPLLSYLRDNSVNRALAVQLETMLAEAGAETSIVQWLTTSKAAPKRLSASAALETDSVRLAASLGDAAHQYIDSAHVSAARLERGSFIWVYVVVGLFVGVSVIAMYMPIFKIGSAV